MLAANTRPRPQLRIRPAADRLASFAVQHAWLALPFLALPAVLPYFLTGFPETADGHLHLLRLALIDRYIEQGWLYPRWIPDLVLGRGYPLLNFYAPASYYLAEGLHLLGFGYQHATALAFGLLILFAGGGMYLLAGQVFGSSHRAARLLAATAYMYAPYLMANSYVRGAIAEVGAQALLPWVFWTTHRLLTRGEPRRDVVPAALAIAGVAVTHNITLLFLPLVWLAYVLVLWFKGGRQRGLLIWAVAAGILAMGLSAFFWLPAAVERSYLSDAAYKISARFLHENVWTLGDFLDPHFFFKYGYDVPYRLGLVQFVLAIAGFFLARRRDAVWLFYGVLALVLALAICQWTLPIWLGVKLLLTVQFPWRLLSVLSVPLALFTGAIVLHLRRGWVRFGVSLALIALIIVAQRPRPSWVTSMALDSAPVNPASAARFELDAGALGTSNSSEFVPSWVKSSHFLDVADVAPAAGQIQLRSANAFDLALEVTGEGGPLRVNTFYYPGWSAVLDGGQTLAAYPSTTLGLLTVDVPAGSHELSLRWEGTPLARVAGIISLLALLAAGLWCLFLRPRQLLCVPLLILAALAGLAVFYRPPLNPVLAPASTVKTDSVQLLGYQLEPGDAQHVLVRPFWYTSRTPPADLRVRWQLLDAGGQVLTQVEGTPFYGTTPGSDWPPATVVPDIYRLPLPPPTAQGPFRLAVQIEEPGAGGSHAPVIAGAADLPAAAAGLAEPASPLDVRFADSVLLRGYTLLVNGRPVSLGQTPPPVVRAGDKLEYYLYWQGIGQNSSDYHGFVHLLDQAGKSLTERDQMAGTIYLPPTQWDAASQPPDRYRLIIPEDSPSGIYSPDVGLYAAGLQRLPVKAAGTAEGASYYRLPPIKVVGKRQGLPEHPLSVRFGDVAHLTGYTLQVPPQLHPGDEIRLTLYYQADKNTGQNLTRFAQLHSPELGMAAQSDGIPHGGENPTWSWAPGEQISEEVVLSVAPDARPGRYTLAVGLYDAQNGGARVPALDGAGNPLPDSRVVLTELDVAPAR